MVTKDAVLEVLHTIADPEMPISIVDLGIVADVEVEADSLVIHLLPTFVGCPALDAIEKEVRRRLNALAGVAQVAVHFRFDPPWTVDRISRAGREALKKFGVTAPRQAETAALHCPFCGSSAVELESPFGPTRCRMIYYCSSCRNSFEHMKRVSLPLHR